MGKVSEERLYMAPAFTIVQVDLFGPYTAKCKHNHRSTVKIWGAVHVHVHAQCHVHGDGGRRRPCYGLVQH
jgi:hypothetical protein